MYFVWYGLTLMPYDSPQTLFFILNPPMPRVVPQNIPFVPLQDQLLWKKNPHFQELSKVNACDAINKRICELVIDLVGKPLVGPYPPHHNDHPISKPLIGVGQSNYQRIGSYFIIISNLFNNLPLLVTQNILVPACCQQGMLKKGVLLQSQLHRGVPYATQHANPTSPHARGAPASSTIVGNGKAP